MTEITVFPMFLAHVAEFLDSYTFLRDYTRGGTGRTEERSMDGRDDGEGDWG